jgi:hypothetical protein
MQTALIMQTVSIMLGAVPNEWEREWEREREADSSSENEELTRSASHQ